METKRITVGGRVEESEIGFNVCGVYEDASSVRTQVWEGGDIEAVITALRGIPTFTPSIELARAAIAKVGVDGQTPATLERGEFDGYKVSLSCDPVYYGSECTDADAQRIFRNLAELIRSQFPGIQVARWDDTRRSSATTGPDEAVCDEIHQWISDNWTKAL